MRPKLAGPARQFATSTGVRKMGLNEDDASGLPLNDAAPPRKCEHADDLIHPEQSAQVINELLFADRRLLTLHL